MTETHYATYGIEGNRWSAASVANPLPSEVPIPRSTLPYVAVEPTSNRSVEIPDGVTVPSTARIPPGATFADSDDEPGRCRLIRADGSRCRGPRVAKLGYAVCSGHAGLGISADPHGGQKLSAASKLRVRQRRQLLGITENGRVSPRALARERAYERASEIAASLVDVPLDARDLSPVQRQLVANRIIDAVFPVTEVTAEISLDDPEGMSWSAMQRIAAQLALSEPLAGEIEENGDGVPGEP